MSADFCMLCGERIHPGEESHATYIDASTGGYKHVHTDCALRTVLGGIGHLENCAFWCVERGDPDGGYSYRDSSRLVRSWANDNLLDPNKAQPWTDQHEEGA